MNTNELIDNLVSDLFVKLTDNENLKIGDISPEQAILTDEFKKMLKDFVQQNKGLK